jgi:hypothetical protein
MFLLYINNEITEPKTILFSQFLRKNAMFNNIAVITTKVVSSNPVHGEVYSIQHYEKKFVSDLRQVGGFLQFPPPIKLTATL